MVNFLLKELSIDFYMLVKVVVYLLALRKLIVLSNYENIFNSYLK